MNHIASEMILEAETGDWEKIRVQYGKDFLDVRVPPGCETLRMRRMPCLTSSKEGITRALNNPIGSPTLSEIIRSKRKKPQELSVCITVSDITRPVPYKGEAGILIPLTETIELARVRRENIVILIGNGMHRPSTPQERLFMYGKEITERYRIVDHNSEDAASMVMAARTTRGTEVYLNRLFYESDVRIITGLVESHFMAGVSGGRKAVCPALVNTKTIQRFHGVDFLEHPNAANLVLDGNPCHEEALEVAQTVGVDFQVSATLDNALCLTGVFCGDLVYAHRAAAEAMKEYVRIPIEKPYDVVLTHAGYVGRDHYQSVKAAVGAIPAVTKNGVIVILANNVDAEPIGSREYKTLLHLLKIMGPEGYIAMLSHPDWTFTKDQWEPEMWAKPIRKVGMEGLIYCCTQIPRDDFQIIPGISGWNFIPEDRLFPDDKEKAETMLQNAVIYAMNHPRFKGRKPTLAFIEEGPYAIPMLA